MSDPIADFTHKWAGEMAHLRVQVIEMNRMAEYILTVVNEADGQSAIPRMARIKAAATRMAGISNEPATLPRGDQGEAGANGAAEVG